MSVIVLLYLWHKGYKNAYEVHCTSRMSQLLHDFVHISQELIFEVSSKDVSKEKLDLSSIQKVFPYPELLSVYRSNLVLWKMFNASPGNGRFCPVEQSLGWEWDLSRAVV